MAPTINNEIGIRRGGDLDVIPRQCCRNIWKCRSAVPYPAPPRGWDEHTVPVTHAGNGTLTGLRQEWLDWFILPPPCQSIACSGPFSSRKASRTLKTPSADADGVFV